MAQQQIIITLSDDTDNGNIDMNIDFEPDMKGPGSEEYAEMSENEKALQNAAGNLTVKFLEVVKDSEE
jgi:hypothetical protein